MKNILSLSFIVFFIATGMSQASAQLIVSAGGVDPTYNSTNWISSGGYAQFSGNVSGVNWNSGGAREGTDWTYGYGSGGSEPSPTTQWGTGTTATVAQDPTGEGGGGNGGGSQLYIDQGMVTDLNGSNLTIAEIAPEAGYFSLNGVTDQATAAGQILLWNATNANVVAAVGQTITFSAVGTDDVTPTSTGPIGFSDEAVPEPSTWALVGLGLGAGLFLARRRLIA